MATYRGFGVEIDEAVMDDVANQLLTEEALEYVVRRVNTENFQWDRILRVTGAAHPGEFVDLSCRFSCLLFPFFVLGCVRQLELKQEFVPVFRC